MLILLLLAPFPYLSILPRLSDRFRTYYLTKPLRIHSNVKGYRIIVKDALRYPFGLPVTIFRLPDSQLEHLLAPTFASQFVIDNHEAEAHQGFVLRRVSQQDMPDDGIPDDSRKRIRVVAAVLLQINLMCCAGKSLYLSALKAECLSVLAPTQYRLCIVGIEWSELHLIHHSMTKLRG